MRIFKLLGKTYLLFWGLIPILIIYSFFIKDNLVDVSIHDTYFVLPKYFFLIPLIFISYLTGLGYYLSYKSDKFRPINFLTLLHIFLFFVGLLMLFAYPYWTENFPVTDFNEVKENLRINKLNSRLIFISLVSFLVAQIILVVNLTISIVRK